MVFYHSTSVLFRQFHLERESCVVIVTSTTGDGDPPDTAQKFFRRLRKKTLSSDYLSDLHYAVLGNLFNGGMLPLCCLKIQMVRQTTYIKTNKTEECVYAVLMQKKNIFFLIFKGDYISSRFLVNILFPVRFVFYCFNSLDMFLLRIPLSLHDFRYIVHQ